MPGRTKPQPEDDAQPAASPLSIEDTLAKLKEPVPEDQVMRRPGPRDRNGNVKELSYVEWHTVADILDAACPDWVHEVKSIQQIGEGVVTTVKLTICGVSREGVGVGAANTDMGIKKSEHDALKRAAVKFGVGRELYKSEAVHEQEYGTYQGAQPAPYTPGQPPPQFSGPPQGGAPAYSGGGAPPQGGGQFNSGYIIGQLTPPNPIKAGPSDGVSEKQGKMAFAIGKQIGLDYQTEVAAIFGAGWTLEHLNSKAVSWFLDHLKAIQAGTVMPAQYANPNTGQVVDTSAQYNQAPQAPAYQAPQPPAQPGNFAPPPAAQAPAQPPVARQPVPQAQPQAASPDQGKFATPAQIAAIRRLAEPMGWSEEDVALEYSQQRTQDLTELSMAEAAQAITNMQG